MKRKRSPFHSTSTSTPYYGNDNLIIRLVSAVVVSSKKQIPHVERKDCEAVTSRRLIRGGMIGLSAARVDRVVGAEGSLAVGLAVHGSNLGSVLAEGLVDLVTEAVDSV
jgi:hypothetical protein